ncbi:hypothetical protein [Marinivivus vitaminiproducens]|uniref:hypothetical protein n=1 Tax=Marinivivus vitaminiproducens TaxID=3035935 RepID=UPI0027A788BE|nr:hypothetical protein P4R82_17785 [Geminicoccaceae bacterium SCSIO 64248]
MHTRICPVVPLAVLALGLGGCSPVMVAALPSVVASVGPYLTPEEESADSWKIQPAAGPAADEARSFETVWQSEPAAGPAETPMSAVGHESRSCRATLGAAARDGGMDAIDALPGFDVRYTGAAAPDGDGADPRPCRLDLAERRPALATRSTISSRSTASAYRAGTEPVPNAARRLAERKVALAKQAVDERVHVMRTGDPGLDLIGLVVGGAIATVVRSSEDRAYEDARAELEAMPETIDQARYAGYSYVETVVEARKTTTWSATLTDQRTGERWQGDLDWQAWQRFTLGDGVHALDRDHPGGEGLGTLDAIAAWERSTVPPPIAAIDAVLLPAMASAGESGASGAPSVPLLLRVEGAAGEAFGFYVQPNIVATRSAALGRSGVPTVRDASGQAMPGLLLRADARHGLALLQVPRSGEPLELAAAAAGETASAAPPAAGATVAGQPILRGRTVLGIVTENGSVQGTGPIRALMNAPGPADDGSVEYDKHNLLSLARHKTTS